MFPLKTIAKASFILLGTSLCLTAVQAETLKIEGMNPAGEPGFATIESLSIDRFGGGDGTALAFALEDKLSNIVIYDQPYFNVIAGRSAIDPQASLSGTATAGIDEYKIKEYRSRCVERDEKDNCVKRKDIKVSCLKREIDFRAQVRATRFRDGQTIYAATKPDSHEQTICYGEDEEFSNSEKIVRDMIAKAADSIRHDLAPVSYRTNVRVLESRKGMAKVDAKYFKAAVKMTKSDETEACRMWDEAAAGGLAHVSLSFNRGLCAQRRGDLDQALVLYRDAESLSKRKIEIRQAISRVQNHQQALEEWDARQLARENAAPVEQG